LTSDVDEATAQVRGVLDRLLAEGSLVSRLDGSIHDVFPIGIGRDEGGALAEIVRREHATRTIEVGLGYGISTLCICEGLLSGSAPGRHVALDPNQSTRFSDCGLQVLEDAGVREMVVHLPERSELALPRLLQAGERFDFAFVDGNHRFDGAFLDLVYLGRLLEPGRLIVVDDCQLPAISRSVAFFVTNLSWTVEDRSTDDPQHHWAAVRTATGADERPYDFFVEF
jgi:predicted O-methyltransferase YrrM